MESKILKSRGLAPFNQFPLDLDVSNYSTPRKHNSTYVSSSCNFYAFFRLIPYKFQWNSNDGVFELKTSRKRKVSKRQVICGLVHLLCIILSFIWLGHLINKAKSSPNDLAMIFNIVSNSACMLLTINTSFILWKKKEELLDFVNTTAHYQASKVKLKVGLLCSITCVLTVLAKALDGYDMIIKPSDYVAGYISSSFVDSEKSPHAVHYTTFTLKWIAYMVHFSCQGFYSFCILILVAFVLTLKCYCDDFVKRLKLATVADKPECISWGLKLISDVRQLKEKVDDILCNSVLFIYILSLSNFGQTPSVYLQNTSIGNKLPFFTFLVSNGMFWLLASEFHSKVDFSIKKWVYRYGNEAWITTTDKMRLILAGNEIEAMPIGLSCQFFTTTFGFVGSMLGLIITYAIIIFQVQAGPNGANNKC